MQGWDLPEHILWSSLPRIPKISKRCFVWMTQLFGDHSPNFAIYRMH